MTATLKAILQVDKDHRVQCQQPGCAHGVYRAIHVIEEDGKLSVLGSTCFKKRFGRDDALGKPKYGSGTGQMLSSEERQMLIDNTAALIEQLEKQQREQREIAQVKLAALHAAFQKKYAPAPRPVVNENPDLLGVPWIWAKSMPSIAYFQMKDGTAWVRVQHQEGFHMLMPWPWFDGWDEVFPSSVGSPVHDIGGIKVQPTELVHTVTYLRERANSMQVGIWREIFGAQKHRHGA